MTAYTGTLPTLPAGKMPPATDWLELLNLSHALADPWSTWAPTLTNLTVGSGTLITRYQQTGKTVHYLIIFTYGTGSVVGTGPTISLPVPAHASYPLNAQFIGSDAKYGGSSPWIGEVVLLTSSTITFYSYTSTSAYTGVTATSPWTWTTSYRIQASGFYEAA